uniref:Uncharacterized protein n=1 Tax=Meloidogyne hapla TaxID=6305 RepID=A0A1I8BFK1_MELHA
MTKNHKSGHNPKRMPKMAYLMSKTSSHFSVTPKKPPITPDNADFKLKGVSQVQVRASPEHMEENEQNNENEELSEQQLQLKLQQENSQKKKQKHLIKENKKKNKKKNKNKKGERILEEEFDELANLEEFARIDEQTICDAIACDFETGEGNIIVILTEDH